MDAAQAKALRAPFDPKLIGKKPQPLKAGAEKGRCNECGGWHGLPAIHLDYVGHAAVTDRLLQVDPTWSWEPVASEEWGLPAFDSKGGLWIRMTVAGVTRPGYGDGPDPKQCISDAIRNAAMRFGVGLDLWSKEDIQTSGGAGAGVTVSASPSDLKSVGGEEAVTYREGETTPDPPTDAPSLDDLIKAAGSRAKARAVLNETAGTSYTAATMPQASAFELQLALAALQEAVPA